MKIASLQQELQQNSYPGRGIVLGRSEDGNYAVSAYFLLWMIGLHALCWRCAFLHHDLDLLLAMRFLQGIASGAMIPVLMMAALRTLRPHTAARTGAVCAYGHFRAEPFDLAGGSLDGRPVRLALECTGRYFRSRPLPPC